MSPEIRVSVGELADRITILHLKRARIRDPRKLANVASELATLEAVFERELQPFDLAVPLVSALYDVNERLWDLVEAVQRCEVERDFGPRFTEAARQISRLNAERHRLKREVSEAYGSDFWEEKSSGTDEADAQA